MAEPASPAILFLPEAYETARKDLMGRAVACRGFLQGLIRFGGLATLHGYTPRAHFEAQFEQLTRDLGAGMPDRIIEGHRLDRLAELGGLVLCDPNLADFARQRSFIGARAYFLTGLSHTLADFRAM